MALSQRLEFRQTQSLVMTPQLMQAIKLLQLSNLDLTTYVEAELERNPVLDRADSDGVAADEPPAALSADPAEGDWLREDMAPSRQALEEGLGTDLDNVFPDERPPERVEAPAAIEQAAGSDPYVSSWSNIGAGGHGGEDDVNFEGLTAAETSLADHLETQLMLAVEDPRLRMIGHFIIDMIDETGYFAGNLDEIAERLDAEPADVEAVLAVVQGFDPSGVGARSLKECLAIQLGERDRLDPAMAALLEHLDLVAKRNIPALRRVCGVDEEDVAEMIAELRALTPKPGLAFGSAPIQPVVPDVLLRSAPDGTWLVELNADTLPRVLVNQAYYARVARNVRNDADKVFLAEALQTANWLTRSLEQRARTILKVATEIVRQQDAFFALGIQYLRPLNLKIVADAIGMHESTVSRVTANKFIASARGLFELKYFFTASIGSSDRGGEAHSAEAVRHRIRQMIDAEAPNDILSDDTIVKLLREAGVDIARRTVAKYRESMRIASSVERRREKARR
ncbi:RNA polymerase factor sigma-54 [Labrys monachus]|uniref:RNA polymerase sigma-54 factor n=1 Tax=Labrys monachus TaxID=217067 RepID=A0ABU0FDA0_9HYPH|nr:RNA polymerase factor sigma-54 [Labrys monachus]MDQ0392560.1 RNA polymerase sigma-54 factor [Labrys monachus]